MSKGKTLGLVVRVSRVGGREGERFQSPKEQVKEGTRVAQLAGYDVRVFDADLDVSGATPFDERPGMGEALRLVESGELAGIVVSARDRLVRQDAAKGVTLAAFQQRIRKAGAVLLVADTPDACIGSPDQEELEGYAGLGLDVLVSLDGRYREEMRKRWRKARANAVERGVKPGNTPAGYDRDADGRLVPNEYAPAIVEAFRQRAAGGSWREVARVLTDAGVPNRRVKYLERHGAEKFREAHGRPFTEADRRWGLKATSKLLTSEVYVGKVKSGPYVSEEVPGQRIIDDVTFLQVKRSLVTRPEPRTRKVPGLLTGVLYCSGCGRRMVQDSNSRTTFYRCGTGNECDARATVTHRIAEPYVAQQVLDYWNGVATAERPPADRTPELETALAVARDGLTEVQAARDSLRPLAYAQALDAALAAVEAAEEELAEYQPHATAPARTHLDRLRGLDPAEAHAEFRTLIQRAVERIEVARGRGTVETKVKITWRDSAYEESLGASEWSAVERETGVAA